MQDPNTPGAKGAHARLVVTDASGHPLASGPATELAPLRFHIQKILVPVDFSEPSRKSLRYAERFAEQFGAKLVLLHVVEPMVYPADFGYMPIDPAAVENERIEDLKTELARFAEAVPKTVEVEQAVLLGRAWKVITDYAAEKAADLVVVSTHGYTGLQHALLGSVAEKIVRHAHCPVLVVREHERDFA
jgi:universal stress protein A